MIERIWHIVITIIVLNKLDEQMNEEAFYSSTSLAF